MPIRINLLAEEQALEELRRKDPVKRVILGGIVLVAAVLAWSVWLVGRTMVRKSELTTLETTFNSKTNQYGQIIFNKNTLDDDRVKLAALHRLSTNRFLAGTLLNALQKATADNVQLVRLKVTQNYVVTEDPKAKSGSEGSEGGGDRTSAKPASATEKIALTLNGKDNSTEPGISVQKFQDALSASPYFQELLSKANDFRLLQRGLPQTDPEGKTFVLFLLESQLPEKKR